jgi:hypothetical protein
MQHRRRRHAAPRKTMCWDTCPKVEGKTRNTAVSIEQFLKHQIMISDGQNM